MDLDVLLIGDQDIDYADIRHIKIHDFRKWSAEENKALPHPFEKDGYEVTTISDQEKIDTAFTEYFTDNEWIE
nr:hypothetical protein [Enterococcus plantarum]